MPHFIFTLITCLAVLLTIPFDTTAQNCTITIPNGIDFDDVNHLETFLTNQTIGLSCTEITIDGDIDLNCNFQPSNLNFSGVQIDKISIITGDLEISSCRSLLTIEGFTKLSSVEGKFRITGSNDLINVGGFSQLQFVGDDFEIGYHSNLTDIGDFSRLCSIGGSFSIFANDKLINIGDFSQLCSIERSFDIGVNPDLTTIGNFSQLCSIGGGFAIRHNTSLSACCTFKPILNSGNIAFFVFINNNGSNCDSENSILDMSICPDPTIESTCKTDLDIRLNACGSSYITPCDLIEGPCCGFTSNFAGTAIDPILKLTCKDIGIRTVDVIDENGSICEVILTISAPFGICQCEPVTPSIISNKAVSRN